MISPFKSVNLEVACLGIQGDTSKGNFEQRLLLLDLQRGGLRGPGPGRAARDFDSVEGEIGLGRVRPGSSRVQRIQASEYATCSIRRR